MAACCSAVERGAPGSGLDVDCGGALVEDETDEGVVAPAGGPEERGNAVFVLDGDFVDAWGEEGCGAVVGELEGEEGFEGEFLGDEG